MAEVAFRPARQLSEYKGKGASASREINRTSELKLWKRFQTLVHITIAICICPLLPKSIQDLQRITVLPSFVYISVFFWKPRAMRFSNWVFTTEFLRITMNGTGLDRRQVKTF